MSSIASANPAQCHTWQRNSSDVAKPPSFPSTRTGTEIQSCKALRAVARPEGQLLWIARHNLFLLHQILSMVRTRGRISTKPCRRS